MSTAKTDVKPFTLLEQSARILGADGSLLLHATFCRSLAAHIIICGHASSEFRLDALEAGSGANVESCLFFSAIGSGLAETPWRVNFVAVIDASDKNLDLAIRTLGIRAVFRLQAAGLSRDLTGIDAHVAVQAIWPVLDALKPFSPDWHNFLLHLGSEKLAASEPLELRNQEILDKLLPALDEYNPAGWQAHIDGYDSLCLTGWAMREASPVSQKVDIFLNGQCVQQGVEANLSRPDVAAAGFGHGRYGFRINTPAAGNDGDILVFTVRDPASSAVIAIQIYYYPFEDIKFKAYLEYYQNIFKGWCIACDYPERIVELDFYINNVFYGSCKNDKPRDDLLKKGISLGLGGFELDSPMAYMPAGKHTLRLEFLGGRKFSEFDMEIKAGKAKPLLNLDAVAKPVSIVIPFYNDPCIEECLGALFAHTPLNVEIIIVDDRSPDYDAAEILAKFNYAHKVKIIRKPVNEGFSGAVNTGIEAAGQNDVVLLNSDARVTPRWLQSLLLTAASADRVATVTPMSDRAGAFSAPERGNNNALPIGCGEAEYARAFRRASFGFRPVVPTGHGFCMYINRLCLNEIGMFNQQTFTVMYGEENDFCMRALRAGWQHLIDDRTYVFHERPTSFLPERKELMRSRSVLIDRMYPEYANARTVFRKGQRLRFARFAGAIAAHDWLRLSRLRIMYVMAVSGGGTPQTNMDLMREFQEIAQCFLLCCDTLVMRLYELNNGELVLLEEHELEEQIEPVSHISAEYDAIAAAWLYEYDIDILHIRQIMWHSLGLFEVAKKLGRKIVYSFHDFYALCPTLNLIDDAGVFRGDDYTECPSPYRVNIWHRSGKGHLPVHDAGYRQFWGQRMLKYLRLCDAYVTTSEESRNIIMEEMPGLDDSRLRVIPHGRNFGRMTSAGKRARPFGAVTLLAPGNIDYHKGASVIEALAAYDQSHDDCVTFHIIGRWHGASHPKIVCHNGYFREDFQQLAADIGPDAGVIFSIWSETWCHTLTELWASGVPAFVFDIGTQAARVRESGGGWILPLGDIQEIYERIISISHNMEERANAEKAIGRWQNVEGVAGNTKLMAARYYDLYTDILSGWPEKKLPPRKLAVVCTKAGLGSSHLRVIEQTINDFKRNTTYIQANDEQLHAYAALGIMDYAIIQRNALSKVFVKPIIENMARSSIPYLYEIDDDLFNISQDKDPNQCYESYRPHMRHMMKHATKVTVSTPALRARYAAEFPAVQLLRTKLGKRHWLKPIAKRKPDSFVRAMYQGTPTHMEDLLLVLPALRKAWEKFPYFRVMLLRVGENLEKLSSENPFLEFIDVPGTCKPYPNFTQKLHELAREADFGIAPLVASHFNECKSFIKIIEYAGLGLPGIASNVVPYTELAGFPHLLLADNNEEAWLKALTAKITRGRKNRIDGVEAYMRVYENYMLHDEDLRRLDGIYTM